jgi:hypothetical protein
MDWGVAIQIPRVWSSWFYGRPLPAYLKPASRLAIKIDDMIETGAVVLIYLSLLSFGAVLSFRTKPQPRRRNIRIATAILTIPIWTTIAPVVALWLVFGKEPPTLAALQRDFPSRRVDLETILRMSDDDRDFSRIAPDFVDRNIDDSKDWGRYMWGDHDLQPEWYKARHSTNCFSRRLHYG